MNARNLQLECARMLYEASIVLCGATKGFNESVLRRFDHMERIENKRTAKTVYGKRRRDLE